MTEPNTHQPALSDAERKMLAYALDLAQEKIWSEDGFTDADQAAVDSLRRDADGPAAAASVPVPVPPADRAARRDRIAEALYAHDHPSHLVPLNETGMEPAYRESADAVLGVLPEPVDRAAVLAEAADRAEDVAVRLHRAHDVGGSTGAYEVMTELRRMAVEAQPAVPAATHTTEDEPQFGVDDCTCVPFTRQTDPPRYLNRPTDTVDMVSGWERGRDCPHHAPDEAAS